MVYAFANFMSVQYFIVEEPFEGRRIDYWFRSKYSHINNTYLEKLFRTGQIRVNGGRIKSSHRLQIGEKIRVPPNLNLFKPNLTTKKKSIRSGLVQNILERVLYSDANLLAIDKPQGLPVQGGSKIKESLDDILDFLRFDSQERPRLVHRLDKDTGGVLLLARNAQASVKLTKMFSSRLVRKLYWGLVEGDEINDDGIISFSLNKTLTPVFGERVIVSESGKNAITVFRKIISVKGFSLLTLAPITGRTHQLRVHCAQLKMPIVGDLKYGNKKIDSPFLKNAVSLQLFARSIEMKGFDGNNIFIKAPIPEYMERNFINLDIKINEKKLDDLSFIKKFSSGN